MGSSRDGAEAAHQMRRHLEGVKQVVKRSGRTHQVLLPPEVWRGGEAEDA